MAWRFSGVVPSGPYQGPWRVARSIITLANEVDASYPNRSRTSDGTLGNTAHQNRDSDHNPNIDDGTVNVVTAIDITEDVGDGLDMRVLFDRFRAGRDPRIKYMIHQGEICKTYFNRGYEPWEWQPYTGENAHLSHGHLSVSAAKSLYDDPRSWNIGADMADHPPTTQGELNATHAISEEPTYFGVWPSYVDAGLTTVPDSWRFPAIRLDLAWLHNKAIAPLATKITRLEAEVRDLKTVNGQQASAITAMGARLAAVEARPPTSPGSMVDAEARVAIDRLRAHLKLSP
jgi:hypothetical protein